MSPISARNPPMRANRIGIRISAVMANMRFDMMRYMNVLIIKNPRRESIGWGKGEWKSVAASGLARRLRRNTQEI
jgi:hypothetical protein